MTNAARACAAGLLAAALGCGALAQDRPAAAPAEAAKAHAAPQDLEPLGEHLRSRKRAGCEARGASQAPAAPAKGVAKAPRRAPRRAADGKPKGNAKDRLELDTTQITGNRELPKVMYVVPVEALGPRRPGRQAGQQPAR